MPVLFDVNTENEQIVLGSMIADADFRRAALPKLTEDLFVDKVNSKLYLALREIERRGVEAAPDTIVQLTGESVSFKYARDLAQNFSGLPRENLEVHLEILRREAAKERGREAFGQLFDLLDSPHSKLAEIEEKTAEVLREVRDPGSRGSRRSGPKVAEEWYEDLRTAASGDTSNFRQTFFSALDELLFEGLKPGNLVVLAARPGMGKTTLCSNLTMRQTLRGRRVLSVPVEPGCDAVVEQMTCARARVSAEKIVKDPRELTKPELRAVKKASAEIFANDLLEIDDAVGTLDELEAIVEAEDYDLVLLDLWEYLLKDLDPVVVTQQLRRMKMLAKRRGFCVVCVHQIKRLDRKKNPRPQLHELKNSGGYEEVADLVLILHRQRYYDKKCEHDYLEVDVAKQRRGPQNVRVAFEFYPEVCRVGKHVENFDERDV